jgi:general secretion pathway protein E
MSTAPSLLDATHIHAARQAAAATARPIVEILEEQLGVAPEAFLTLLADALRYPALRLEQLGGLTPAFDLLPYHEALGKKVVAFRDGDARLQLVFCNPFEDSLDNWADTRFSLPYGWTLVHHADLDAYLARYEETMHAMDSVLTTNDNAAVALSGVEDLSLKAISEHSSPVVRLVHSTLYDALKSEASDIHLETGSGGLTIKYRIDGVLSLVRSLQGTELAEQIISRVKVMAELDIAERRIPQDGRFKITVRGREIDFRVSIMPSIFGEDAVLRILDKQALSDHIRGLRLDYLGFDQKDITVLRRMIAEPYGMFLVTGPTGSGKTTTLYAAITEINHGHDKIVTIEDPVEYQLPGVLQIPVNEKKGLTFARGLRSILRHDPDKIMVGEIRDTETAQIAVQSALTGHLVFTTVHANNVFDVIGRFIHMGVAPSSFVSALNGILAQRLVRQNCPSCSQPVAHDAALLAESGIAPEAARDFQFRAGSGCAACRGSGFKGRKAIAEILYLNDEIREMIVAGESIRKLKEAAQRQGTRLLRTSAIDLVRRGDTTLQEINRVTLVS